MPKRVAHDDAVDRLEKNRIDTRRIKEKDSNDLKVVESVFNKATVLTIDKLIRKGVLKKLVGIVSTGKEANVYRGEAGDGTPLAVKIYRMSTAETDFMLEYIIGDPRFKRVKRRSRVLIPQSAMKEYKNLQQVERCFNDLKNCLKLRPVYHWTDNRTRGHVFVCVLSLLLEKLMEKHTRRTFREIKETLEPVRVNRIEVYGKVIYKRNSISQSGKEVLSDLGIEPPPRVLIV